MNKNTKSKKKITLEKIKDEEINYSFKSDDSNWVLTKNNLYRYNESKLPNIEIAITDEMIELSKVSAKLYNEGITDEKKDITVDKKTIYYFIKMYDITNTIQPSIRYSKLLLNEIVKSDLMFSHVDGKVTKLTPFLINTKNVRYKIIDAYMSDICVQSEMNNIRKNYETNIKNLEIKEEVEIPINEIYREYLTLEIKKLNTEKLNKKKYFIYRLTNNDEEYIFGIFNKMKKTDYKKICDKYNIIFTNNELNVLFEEIQVEEIYFECEGQLKVDDILYSKNIIKKCLNDNYNIIRNFSKDIKISTRNKKIKNDIYLLVKKDYMKSLKICDNYDYDKLLGYIAYIKSDKNDIHVFSGYKTSIMSTLENMYIENKCEILINNDISTLKFKIVEKYINIYDLEIKETYYKNQLEIIKNEEDKEKQSEKKIKPYWNKFKYVQKNTKK